MDLGLKTDMHWSNALNWAWNAGTFSRRADEGLVRLILEPGAGNVGTFSRREGEGLVLLLERCKRRKTSFVLCCRTAKELDCGQRLDLEGLVRYSF